jgi:hypothetical protein
LRLFKKASASSGRLSASRLTMPGETLLRYKEEKARRRQFTSIDKFILHDWWMTDKPYLRD